jgi:hypothetical protein
MSSWQPRASGLWIEPGRAKTSRPAIPARRAVIREPEALAASTTTVPAASPAMMRFRCGKCAATGGVPGGNSDTTAPLPAIRRASDWFCGG